MHTKGVECQNTMMQAASEFPALADLEWVPFIDADGQLPQRFAGQIGVYAIYTAESELAYIGYSRDVALSLKQHLVRQPQVCMGVKVHTVERPNRTLLETIKAAWIAEHDAVPIGNSESQTQWEQPIDVKAQMLPEEQLRYGDPQLDERQHLSILKQAARRIEQDILTQLEARGLQESLRFNPKLKEEGLLDLK
jgi:hypothetical protein